MDSRLLLVVGAGPGLGAAVARRWGSAGYDVALVGRRADALEALTDALTRERITAEALPADIADPAALTEAIERLGRRLGRIDALHYNPSVFRQADPLQLNPAELLEDFAVGVAGLLTAVQAARTMMPPGSRITVTGSMAADHPWHEACSLGVQKAGLRNLVLSVDRTLAPSGVRALSLTVNGTLAPGTAFSPERVADALYLAAQVPDDAWRAEVPYDG